MKEPLDPVRRAEHSITKTYRASLWTPFIAAVKRYELISPGDRIAVCVSGGKDSMLLAKMIQMLERYTEIPFEAVYLTMDPGYSEVNRKKIEENAARLEIPLRFFETNVFSVANRQEKNPCYLCAKMRRGHLYSRAKELGCSKIALGHHFNDVIETTVLAMLYGSQLQAMIPKVKSLNFEGMELIRPLYCVHEDDIIAWRRYNGLEFLQCACRLTEAGAMSPDGVGTSKRAEVKALIRTLKQTNPDVEKSIFNSIHSVCLDTFPGYKSDGVFHSFLERYNESGTGSEE